MSTIVMELYEALRAAGASDEQARAAAAAVIDGSLRNELATKTDIGLLRADLAELEVRLIKWAVGTLVAMTGVFAAIVKFVH